VYPPPHPDALTDIRAKLHRFAPEPEYDYYSLNFSALALLKSCQVLGMSPEMVFRGVDVQARGEVGWFDLANFLREVMRTSPATQDSTPSSSTPS
jgi:hypothetical protein